MGSTRSKDATHTCGIPEEHAAKVWNAAYYSALVCITPFMNLYYHRLNLPESQIGVLAALAPWIAAPAGSLWAAFADRTGWHKSLLLAASILQLLGRSSAALVHTFPGLVALVVVTEGFGSPVTILSDIAIMSAAEDEGHYGKQRMFASAGWGVFSAMVGWIVSRTNIYSAFIMYSSLTAFALLPACLLKFHLKNHRQHHTRKKPLTIREPLSKEGSSLLSPLLEQHAQDHQGDYMEARDQLIHRQIEDAAAEQLGDPSVAAKLTPSAAAVAAAVAGGRVGNGPGHAPAHRAPEGRHKSHGHVREHLAIADGALHKPRVAVDCAVNADGRVVIDITADPPHAEYVGHHHHRHLRDPTEIALWEAAMLLSNPSMAPPPRHVTPMLSRMSTCSSSSYDTEEEDERKPDRLVPDGVADCQPASTPPYVMLGGAAASHPGGSTRGSVHGRGASRASRRQGVPTSAQMSRRSSLAGSHDYHGHHVRLPFWQGMRQLMANPEALPFFAMSLLMGFAVGLLSTYLFLYLDELKGSELLMGLTLTVTCCVEVPIFAINGWILRTLGVHKVLHLTIAVCLIRTVAYSTLARWPTTWLVLGVEALNGITFACAWPAGTLHCSRIAPYGMEATTQGIFTSLYGGFGTGLGGLFGGFIYNKYGPQKVFQWASYIIIAGWAVCICGQVVAKCICRPACAEPNSCEPIPEEV
eukprot:jgi/Astpho2/9207/fgenesh1_pg.00137_%23_29_t